MELSTILIVIAVSVLWINAGIRAVREMNDLDNDAIEWITFPLVFKIIAILLAPILMPVFERWIFDTEKKK